MYCLFNLLSGVVIERVVDEADVLVVVFRFIQALNHNVQNFLPRTIKTPPSLQL